MLTTGHHADDQRIFHREAKTLAAAGFSACIVAPNTWEGCREGVWFFSLQKPGSRYERLLLGKKLLQRALPLDGKLYIFHEPELFVVALILTFLGRKVVYDCHENLPMQVLKKTWIPYPLRWLLVPILWAMEWLNSRFIAGVIIARDKVANRFPRERTVLVRNFPTRSALELLGQGAPVDKRQNVVIYTGSISRIRGIGELVDAFKELQRRDAELWLVGNFEDEDFKHEILDSLPANVRYYGWKDHGEVLALYQSAKIGVVTLHPTPSHRHSLPVKLFEYMGAGLPVIASNFSELTPFVQGCGIQVNPLDVSEIKNALNSLLYDGMNLAEMSKTARLRVTTQLTWENEGERLIDFCSNLIGRAPGPSAKERDSNAQAPQSAPAAATQIRVHPLVRDLGLTAITQISAFVATMIVTSLFGRLLGVLALGEYLLLRRVWAWMTTVVQLGMQVALPRYVAHAAGGRETRNNCGKYFLAAASCMAGMIFLTTLVLNAGRSEFAELLFGDAHFIHLILPLSLLLAAYAVHGLVYGYYRGILSMGRANALAFCNYSLIPVLSVLTFYHTASTAKIVSCIGLGVATVSCLFSIKIFRSYIQRDSPRFRQQAFELIRYGIARIPGDFGAGAIFALGPIVAAHFMPLARVSSLLLGASVLVSVSVCATPLGVILLSKISMMLVQARIADVRTGLQHMLRAVLELSVFACLQVVIFTDVLIRFWVGSKFLNDLVVIRLAASAIPFYLFYVTFRTVVDAGSVKAYNARNLVVSLVIFLATTALAITVLPPGHLLEGIAVAQLISIAVLAFLTARSLYELYDVRMRWRDSALAIASALLLGAGSLALHWLAGDKLHIVLLALFELAIWPLYLGLLSWQGSTWMPFIWKTAFQEQAITTMAIDSN